MERQLHTHFVYQVTDPQINRGRTKNGTLIVEGLARILPIGWVRSCEKAAEWAETIEECIEDPYQPAIDGGVVLVNLN